MRDPITTRMPLCDLCQRALGVRPPLIVKAVRLAPADEQGTIGLAPGPDRDRHEAANACLLVQQLKVARQGGLVQARQGQGAAGQGAARSGARPRASAAWREGGVWAAQQ